MTLQRIPTYTQAMQDKGLIRRFTNQQSFLQYQIATGRKEKELVSYDRDLPIIQHLRDAISQRERTINGIDKLSVTLNTYRNTLESFTEISQELLKIADQPSGDFDDWSTVVEQPLEDMVLHFRALLNERIGERYVFSGLRFETPPVNSTLDSLADLPNFEINPRPPANNPLDFATYASNVAGEETSLYDTAASAIQPDAFRGLTQVLDYGRPLEHSIGSNDLAFQKLFHGIRIMMSAVSLGNQLTIAERKEMTDAAYEITLEAKTDITKLREVNDIKRNIIFKAKEQHNTQLQTLTLAYHKVVQVDTQEVVITLSQLNNQIQSSYSAMTTRNQLSLVNFLR